MEAKDESASNGAAAEKTKCCLGNGRDGEAGRCGSRRYGWIGAALLFSAIVAVFAYFTQSDDGERYSGWHDRHDPSTFFGASDATRKVEFVVDRVMRELKADDAQKLKAREIAGAAAGDLKELALQHRESRQELVAILGAPTLDRTKLEALRAKTVYSLDQSSKRITVAVADLADVLTPAQRQQLVERIEKEHSFLPRRGA